MVGANFVLIFLILHFLKSTSVLRVVSFQKFVIWALGFMIFLLGLGIAFSGYVLVSGNMSFWAALVILNLATILPVFGDRLVLAILHGSALTSHGLTRFLTIHFLLALVATGLAFLHLIALHRTEPGTSSSFQSDGSETLQVVFAKDLTMLLFVLLALLTEFGRSLIHPDNWTEFSLLETPAHIEPEVYFL